MQKTVNITLVHFNAKKIVELQLISSVSSWESKNIPDPRIESSNCNGLSRSSDDLYGIVNRRDRKSQVPRGLDYTLISRIISALCLDGSHKNIPNYYCKKGTIVF